MAAVRVSQPSQSSIKNLLWRDGARVCGKKADPVAEHDGGGCAGCDIVPKRALGYFRAQRRPAFALCARRKGQKPLFCFRVEIAGGDAWVAITLAREKARYVAKILSLQRQRLVFRVSLEKDELTAEILDETVDATLRRNREQIVAFHPQLVSMQFVEA